ncbi:MAG: NADH-quinone oxidoreductase subunit J family protein [Candidatus Binatia bacterium]
MGFPLFFVLAGLLIAAALGVVLNRHPVRSALCLVSTLFLLAVFFIFLDADFVAALQVIVYAGAIMVVFLFVIMLLNLQDEAPQRRRQGWRVAAGLSASLFGLGFLYLFRKGGMALPGPGVADAVPAGFGSIEAVGVRLFTHFLLPFEITGILMLAAVIGAVVLAKRRIG